MFSSNFYQDLSETFAQYYDSIVELLPKVSIAIILFIGFYFISVVVKRILLKYLKKSLDDQLLVKFIARLVQIIIISATILMCLKVIGLGSLVTGLLGTAGVGAFVLGFAFKDIGEHFLAGILLAFNRPFRIGDTVELHGTKGVVSTLNLRNTKIKSFDGQDIFIPNGNIVKNKVINYTLDGYYRYDFNMILDNTVDVASTILLLKSTLSKVPGILQDPKAPFISVSINENNSLVFTALYWLNTDNKNISAGATKNNAISMVKSELLAAGYKLPGNSIEVIQESLD